MGLVHLGLLTHQPAEEEAEEEPTRNWRPPRGDNDHGALAGEHERAALAALGFGMKLRGKDIAVENGIQRNGFLEAGVLERWGVKNYPAIWGSSGKAVEKAREVEEEEDLLTVNKGWQKVGKHNALSGNTTLGARAQYTAASTIPPLSAWRERGLYYEQCP